MIDIGTKSVTPLAVTPVVRPFTCRARVSSCAVHCRSKPGLDIDSTEIFGSVRIHDVRCASPRAVNHSDPPRPTWAWMVAPMATMTSADDTAAVGFDIYFATPKQYSTPSNVPRYARPLATVSPLKLFHASICVPLDHSSLPVCPSSA